MVVAAQVVVERLSLAAFVASHERTKVPLPGFAAVPGRVNERILTRVWLRMLRNCEGLKAFL